MINILHLRDSPWADGPGRTMLGTAASIDPSTHTSLAKLALNHGMNIYVEKPFALKTADAEDIVSLAKKGV